MAKGKKKEKKDRRSGSDISGVLYLILAVLVAIAALLAIGILKGNTGSMFGALNQGGGGAQSGDDSNSHYTSESYTSGVREDVIPPSKDSADLISK